MVRRDEKIAEASSKYLQRDRDNNTMSEMPCKSGSDARNEKKKTDAEMCGMRKNIQSTGQSYSQNLQLRLSENPGERECFKALEWETEPNIGRLAIGVKNRMDCIVTGKQIGRAHV